MLTYKFQGKQQEPHARRTEGFLKVKAKGMVQSGHLAFLRWLCPVPLTKLPALTSQGCQLEHLVGVGAALHI